MAVVAYLRVSTEKQFLENQREEIIRFAEKNGLSIDRWYMETVSGKVSSKERKLAGLLDRMKPGDSLIITEISRLSRTLLEIMTILNSCIKRGVVLYSTKEGYVFQNDINSKVLGFAFGLMAEIERNLISMRTKEALERRRQERGHTQDEDTLCEQEETCKGAPKRRVVCRTCPADGSVTDYDVPFSETLLSNSAKRRCQRWDSF